MLDNLGEKLQEQPAQSSFEAIRHIEDPSEREQYIRENPGAVRYIENPSEQERMCAIENAKVIDNEEGVHSPFEYIENPTEKEKIAAIEADPLNGLFMDELPEGYECPERESYYYAQQPNIYPHLSISEKLECIRHDNHYLIYTAEKNNDDLVLATAIKKDPDMVSNLEYPSTEMRMIDSIAKGSSQIGDIGYPTEAMQIASVLTDPESIRDIKNPSPIAQLTAVMQVPWLIDDIENPDPDALRSAQTCGLVLGISADALEPAADDNGNMTWTDNRTGVVFSEATLANHFDLHPEDIKNMASPTEKMQIAAVDRDWSAIKWLDDPSKDVQMTAVTQKGIALQYIDNPDKDVRMAAVSQNGLAIRFIQEPTKEEQVAAVSQNGEAVKYIDNPDKDVRMAAVSKDGLAIRFIKDPADDERMTAVAQNGHAVKYIDNPTKEEQITAVSQNGYAVEHIKRPDGDVQKAAVERNPGAIKFIRYPEFDTCMAALEQDGLVIRHIDAYIYPHDVKSLNIAAASENGYAIKHMGDADQNEAVQVAAVLENPDAIRHIIRPREIVERIITAETPFEAQMEAVRHDPEYIECIKDPAPDVRMYVIRNSEMDWDYDYEGGLMASSVMEYIKNPTEEEKIAAMTVDENNGLFMDTVPEGYECYARTDPELINGLYHWHHGNFKLEDLGEVMGFNLTDKEKTELVKKDPSLIRIMKISTEEMKDIAFVGIHPIEISSFENPTEDMKEAAVRKEPYVIKLIDDPSRETQIIAVKGEPDSIKYIKDPHPDAQIVAVSKRPELIEKIENPAPEARAAAIEEDPSLIRTIKNPTIQEQIAVITKDPENIKYIENPSQAAQSAAVTRKGETIQYIANPTETTKLLAVSNSGQAVKHIADPPVLIQVCAVTSDPKALEHIDKPDRYAVETALANDPDVIDKISDEKRVEIEKNHPDMFPDKIDPPSEAVQLEAVKKNGYAIEDIDNPSEAVQLAAAEKDADMEDGVTAEDIDDLDSGTDNDTDSKVD